MSISRTCDTCGHDLTTVDSPYPAPSYFHLTVDTVPNTSASQYSIAMTSPLAKFAGDHDFCSVECLQEFLLTTTPERV